MHKYLLSVFFLFIFFNNSLEAQWYRWGQKYCWGCCRYVNLTAANYDGINYGYVDNINYPATYALPINCQFNYCIPWRYRNNHCKSCPPKKLF